MITIEEIDKIRLALDTPEHNSKYVDHTTDAKKILNKIEEAITVTHCCKSDSELCCEPVGEGFYLGTTCPKCKQPFRQNLK